MPDQETEALFSAYTARLLPPPSWTPTILTPLTVKPWGVLYQVGEVGASPSKVMVVTPDVRASQSDWLLIMVEAPAGVARSAKRIITIAV